MASGEDPVARLPVPRRTCSRQLPLHFAQRRGRVPEGWLLERRLSRFSRSDPQRLAAYKQHFLLGRFLFRQVELDEGATQLGLEEWKWIVGPFLIRKDLLHGSHVAAEDHTQVAAIDFRSLVDFGLILIRDECKFHVMFGCQEIRAVLRRGNSGTQLSYLGFIRTELLLAGRNLNGELHDIALQFCLSRESVNR